MRAFLLADRLAGLVEDRLPFAVDTDGNQDDWNVVGPALLVAAIRQLRSLQHQQSGLPSALVGWQLLRSLFEYVVTFAWIARAPDERSPRWLKADYQQRLKMHNDFATLGEELLEEAVRAALEGYEPALYGLPPVPDRTLAVDAEWAELIQQLDDRLPDDFRRFRLLYPLIYRNGSRFVHPTTHGVNAFVEGVPPELTIAEERPLERDLLMLGDGVVALGLTIASSAVPALGLTVDDVRATLA